MSKMRCQCGHTISNTVCPCPTEATVIGDMAYEFFDDGFTKDVSDFLLAARNGKRDAWIVERFGEVYPKDISDSEVISDLLSGHYRKHAIGLSECEKCGRLWLQQGIEKNAYRSFAPDNGGYGRHLLIAGSAADIGCATEDAMNNPMDRSDESAAS